MVIGEGFPKLLGFLVIQIFGFDRLPQFLDFGWVDFLRLSSLGWRRLLGFRSFLHSFLLFGVLAAYNFAAFEMDAVKSELVLELGF